MIAVVGIIILLAVLTKAAFLLSAFLILFPPLAVLVLGSIVLSVIHRLYPNGDFPMLWIIYSAIVGLRGSITVGYEIFVKKDLYYSVEKLFVEYLIVSAILITVWAVRKCVNKKRRK